MKMDYKAFSTGSSVCTKTIRRILKRNQLAVRAASEEILLRQEWNENDGALIIQTLLERAGLVLLFPTSADSN